MQRIVKSIRETKIRSRKIIPRLGGPRQSSQSRARGLEWEQKWGVLDSNAAMGLETTDWINSVSNNTVVKTSAPHSGSRNDPSTILGLDFISIEQILLQVHEMPSSRRKFCHRPGGRGINKRKRSLNKIAAIIRWKRCVDTRYHHTVPKKGDWVRRDL